VYEFICPIRAVGLFTVCTILFDFITLIFGEEQAYILIISDLFNDALSSSDCIQSNDGLINESIGKDKVGSGSGQFKIIYQHFLEYLRKTTKIKVKIACIRTEI
jgi:hypothetical protein